MSKFTVVMYHYVRRLAGSDYPGIKGLELALFREQISYLKKYYQPVKMEDVIGALDGENSLPPMALLLTFDDGYKDHFVNALPILKENDIQGTFFISARALAEKKVLDVNKIHYTLASVREKKVLLDDIDRMVKDKADADDIVKYNDRLKDDRGNERRYDDNEVVLIKDLLQKKLSKNLRGWITDKLFEKYVSRHEEEFAGSLYLNPDEIVMMKNSGMFIGSHGYDHVWLDTLAGDEQEKEIERGIDFLKSLDCCGNGVVFSYPYGAHDQTTESLLRKNNVAAAFTSRCGIVTCGKENRYNLPRLDTNDLPKNGSAEPCGWTTGVSRKI